MSRKPTLTLRGTDNCEKSYTDAGTGSKQDVSVWRPKLLPNEFRVAYTATNGRAPDGKTVVVKEGDDSDGTALAPPTHFVCKWTDKGTGGRTDGSLWQAVAPPGYVALSDVAVHISNSGISPGTTKSPNTIDPMFRCVHASLAKDAELGPCVWTDKGSGGKYDGACWSIRGSPGMRVSRGGKDEPPNHQHQLAAFTGQLYRDYDMVFAVDNPKGTAEPDAVHKLTIGLSQTNGTSTTTGVELGLEIEQKFTAGVEGIASSSTAFKFSSKFSASTTLSGSTTSTTMTEVAVSVKIPAKTRVELYQLVVTDSQKGGGAGAIKLKSAQYQIVNVPL